MDVRHLSLSSMSDADARYKQRPVAQVNGYAIAIVPIDVRIFGTQ